MCENDGFLKMLSVRKRVWLLAEGTKFEKRIISFSGDAKKQVKWMWYAFSLALRGELNGG